MKTVFPMRLTKNCLFFLALSALLPCLLMGSRLAQAKPKQDPTDLVNEPGKRTTAAVKGSAKLPKKAKPQPASRRAKLIAALGRTVAQAQQSYQSRAYEKAEALLVRQCLQKLAQAGLLHTDLGMQAYVLLGKVYVMENKPDLASKAFLAALQENADLSPTFDRDSPEVQLAWQQAQESQDPAAAPPAPVLVPPSAAPSPVPGPVPQGPPPVPREPSVAQTGEPASAAPEAPLPTAQPAEPTDPPFLALPPFVPSSATKRLFKRFYVGVGLGTGASLLSTGAPLDTVWLYDPIASQFHPATIEPTGFAGSGLHVQLHAGVRVTSQWAVNVLGVIQPYFNNNASSAEQTTALACQDAQGQPMPCYPVSDKKRVGFLFLGEARYTFATQSSFVKPYVTFGLGGARWLSTVGLESSPDRRNGQPRLTDRCSALSEGNAPPDECRSVDGQVGFNKARQTFTPLAPQRLNRVCQPGEPCIDTVTQDRVAASAGFGVYVGSERVGVFAEVHALGLFGEMSGVAFNAAAGPQVSF